MKKTIVILFVMLQFGLILGAKENFSTEGIDVLAVKEGIINGTYKMCLESPKHIFIVNN